MRGQIFTLDAVMAVFLLSIALHTVALANLDTLSFVSRDLILRSWENLSEHAIQTLLLGDGDWACKLAGARVPGCVLQRPYSSQKSKFFPTSVNCYLEGDPSIAVLMGCTDAPHNPVLTYKKTFKTCVGAVDSCTVKTLHLTIWKGR